MNHRRTGTGAGAGANPLRRPADRTRTRLRVAFALACVLAVVCGMLGARAVWNDGVRAADATARHRHPMTATTVGETTYRAGPRPTSPPVTVASASWRYPAQRAHTETVPVPAGTRKGDPVRLWVDDSGRAATPPPGRADIALDAVGFGAGLLGGILLAAGSAVYIRLRIVDTRNARAWETEWEQFEPVWSGRLRPGRGADED